MNPSETVNKGKKDMSEVVGIHDLSSYMDRSEFLRWKSFRESPDSRYIGLVLPRFLLRMPYGAESNPTREFNYEEGVRSEGSENYLWGNATFSFAANMARSHKENGWCVQVRGPQSLTPLIPLIRDPIDSGKPCEGKLHARFDEGGQARARSLLYPLIPHFLFKLTPIY